MQKRKLHITALGSSFAAGPGIEPLEDPTAGRSSLNYAHQLASKLNADLTDLTVSGATLLNVLNEKQHLARQLYEPQLEHLPKGTDIVTLTCGGNDIGYIGCLTQDSLMSYLGGGQETSDSRPTAPFLDLRQLTSRLLAVLDKVHSLAPNARVMLVEYLSTIGNDTRS